MQQQGASGEKLKVDMSCVWCVQYQTCCRVVDHFQTFYWQPCQEGVSAKDAQRLCKDWMSYSSQIGPDLLMLMVQHDSNLCNMLSDRWSSITMPRRMSRYQRKENYISISIQTDGITCVGVTRGLQVNCLKRLAHVQRLIYRLTAHYKISVHVWHVAQEHVQWSQSILTNRLQCLYFLDICTADWSRHFRLNYHFISLHSSYLNQRTNLLMWGPIQRSETRLTHPIFFALGTFCMQVTMTPDIVLQSTFKTHFASTFYTISGVKKKKITIFPSAFQWSWSKKWHEKKTLQVLCT